MPGMRRSVRQKVISGAAVAVLLGGACFAAVSAVGQGNGHERAGARHLHPRDIEAAAAYLGVSSQQLAREAQSKSLAQVAEAHSGKSAEGLTEAIIASRRARLQKLAARLPGRVRAEVSRPARGAAASRGPRALRLFTAPGHLGAAAARYLGLEPAQLRRRLRAGDSLAQIASEIPNRSQASLVAALVAAKQRRIAARLATRQVTPKWVARREARLRTRMDRLVERKFAVSRKP